MESGPPWSWARPPRLTLGCNFFLLKEETSDHSNVFIERGKVLSQECFIERGTVWSSLPPSLSILTIYKDRKKLNRLRAGFLVEGIARQTDRGANRVWGTGFDSQGNIYKNQDTSKLKTQKPQKIKNRIKEEKWLFFLVKIMCIFVRMCWLAYATVAQLSEQNTVQLGWLTAAQFATRLICATQNIWSY